MPNFSEKICDGIQSRILLFSVREVAYSSFFDFGSESLLFFLKCSVVIV